MLENHPTVESTPSVRRSGRPCKLSDAELSQLVELTKEHPSAAIDDLVAMFRKRVGIVLARATVLKYLRAAGVERSTRNQVMEAGIGNVPKNPSDISEKSVPTNRYGYNDSHRDAGDEERYPCGLTDAEWGVVRDLFETDGPGRPPKYSRRQLLDACVYVLRSGCSWRMLPKDFPPWQLVYGSFRRWTSQGLFETLYDRLRKMWRARMDRSVFPTAGIIDSQSVKISPQGGAKGYDAGKKVKGRKRNLVVDTLGLLLVVSVTMASVQDRDLLAPTVEMVKAKYPTIIKVYADGGYAGQQARAMEATCGVAVEIVRPSVHRGIGPWRHPDQQSFDWVSPPKNTFPVLPKRWVVERNNAWNERPRRMNRDHDRRLDVSIAWIWLTEGRMLLRRLTHSG